MLITDHCIWCSQGRNSWPISATVPIIHCIIGSPAQQSAHLAGSYAILDVCSDDGEQLSQEVEEEAVAAVSLKLVSAAPEVDTTGLALMDNTVVRKAATRHLQGIYAHQLIYSAGGHEMKTFRCCGTGGHPAGVASFDLRLSIMCAADATARQVMVNLPYEEMHAPVVGPAHPYQKDGIAAGMKNHRTGHVEVCSLLRTVLPHLRLQARWQLL